MNSKVRLKKFLREKGGSRKWQGMAMEMAHQQQ